MFNIGEYICWFNIIGQKSYKSLTQRWFTKSKVIDNKEKESETKDGVSIRRHTIVSVECVCM